MVKKVLLALLGIAGFVVASLVFPRRDGAIAPHTDGGDTMAFIKTLDQKPTLDVRKTLDTDEAFWDWSVGINLKAQFFAAKAVIPGMQAAGGGAIVQFTSISYMMGMSGYPIYTTSNSGINGMTRSLAREFGPDRIRVNALAPGWVLTEKQLDMWATEEGLEEHLSKMCVKEHLKPQDIVSPCLFLASSASAGMTGQALVVDGGVVVTG